MKVCSSCGEGSPVVEFEPRPGAKDGLRGQCRGCRSKLRAIKYAANPSGQKERTKRYRAKNPGIAAEQMKKWRKANHEKANAARRKNYATNPETAKQYARRWRQENPEAAKVKDRRSNESRNPAEAVKRVRLWRQENPTKAADQSSIRRARLNNAPVVEKIDRMMIFKRDAGLCWICRSTLDISGFTLDHVIPLSKGGEHTARNLKVACQSCNCRKGSKLIGGPIVCL